jgi:hypothetical protein
LISSEPRLRIRSPLANRKSVQFPLHARPRGPIPMHVDARFSPVAA